MDERKQYLDNKLQRIVNISQEIIKQFVGDVYGQETLNKINNIFNNYKFSIAYDEFSNNNFGAETNYDNNTITVTSNLLTKWKSNIIIASIIHEYAHCFSRINLNDQSRSLIEEGFADVFSEICINYNLFKENSIPDIRNNKNIYHSVSNYTEPNEMLRGILFILKQNGKDIIALKEYLFGDKKEFEKVCIDVLGKQFTDFYNDIKNINYKRDISQVQNQLVEVFKTYISNNNISLKDYKNNEIGINNLYGTESKILETACANLDIQKLNDDEKYVLINMRKNIELSKKQKIEHLKALADTMREKYRLDNITSIEDLKNKIIILISDSIEYSSSDNKDKIEKYETLKEIIPEIEKLQKIYLQLRQKNLEDKLYEKLILKNLTYNNILIETSNILINHNFEEKTNLENIYFLKSERIADLDKKNLIIKSRDTYDRTISDINQHNSIINENDNQINDIDNLNTNFKEKKDKLVEEKRNKEKNFFRFFYKKKINELEKEIKLLEEQIQKNNKNKDEIIMNKNNILSKINNAKNEFQKLSGVSIKEYIQNVDAINNEFGFDDIGKKIEQEQENIKLEIIDIQKRMQFLEENNKEIENIVGITQKVDNQVDDVTIMNSIGRKN